MLKKYRRITGLFMGFVTAFALIAPMTALAKDTATTEPSTEEKQVVFSAKGNEVSAALVDDLKAYNITVTDQTVIEVVNTSKNLNGTALTVKNINNGVVDFNYLLALDETGAVKNFSLGNTSRSEELFGNEFDPLSDESVIIAWAVRYNVVLNGTEPHIQPKYAQAILYNDLGDSVSGAKVNYICRGYECTLPNFTNITGSAGTYYIHEMRMTLAEDNKYYTATNAYNSNRVICVTDGGHYVHVEFYVNSYRYWEEIELPDN